MKATLIAFVKLNDWPLIQNTLYEDAVLIDLLNMKGGDQKWVGERRNVGSDNRIKGGEKMKCYWSSK